MPASSPSLVACELHSDEVLAEVVDIARVGIGIPQLELLVAHLEVEIEHRLTQRDLLGYPFVGFTADKHVRESHTMVYDLKWGSCCGFQIIIMYLKVTPQSYSRHNPMRRKVMAKFSLAKR